MQLHGEEGIVVNYPIARTMLSSTMVFAEIRCGNCGKLLLKWMRKGSAILDMKCSRCGHLDVVALST